MPLSWLLVPSGTLGVPCICLTALLVRSGPWNIRRTWNEVKEKEEEATDSGISWKVLGKSRKSSSAFSWAFSSCCLSRVDYNQWLNVTVTAALTTRWPWLLQHLPSISAQPQPFLVNLV